VSLKAAKTKTKLKIRKEEVVFSPIGEALVTERKPDFVRIL